WFGNYVTCATWNDIWLNEGFASYLEYIALQNIESQNSADNWINDAHTETMSQSGGSVFASWGSYRLMYKKAASIIHILRYEINNDSLFYAVLRNYLSTYAFSNSTTDDFKQVAETTTGMDFTDFFNQWYYGEGYPSFHINWNQNNDSLIILSNQITSTSTTPLFKTHFDVKINYLAGDTIIRLFQGSNNEIYKIYFPDFVTSIEVDPNFWLIQKSFINTGIVENNNSLFFSVFPNPAKDKITISVKQENVLHNTTVSVFNLQGELLLRQQIQQKTTELDLSSLAKGVFVLKFNSNNKTEVAKIVKE
ncbi:MAG: T9SS type A sorting domain-containing protein, partial [Bacteroidales bacterium]|nr:T9SS type A sorting domain-containing protein [Bacteroidales bacterium]